MIAIKRTVEDLARTRFAISPMADYHQLPDAAVPGTVPAPSWVGIPDRYTDEWSSTEGPELAEKVAWLEGHPVEWKTLDGQELDDYRDLKLTLTLTRDPADWQPYNPNAERNVRIEAEGLYTDPIHQFTTFDEEEDDPKVEPATLDLDL